MTELKRKNLEEPVEKLVAKWTDILNLRDWDIYVYIMEESLPGSHNKEYAAACIYHSYEHHEAKMYILHPDKWGDISDFWGDKDESCLESIVVHELLHLHFIHQRLEKNWQLAREELAINQLTKAFVRLDADIQSREELLCHIDTHESKT